MWSKPDEWTYSAIKGRALKYEDTRGYLRFAASELRSRIADYQRRRRVLGTGPEDRRMDAKLAGMIDRERNVLRHVEADL